MFRNFHQIRSYLSDLRLVSIGQDIVITCRTGRTLWAGSSGISSGSHRSHRSHRSSRALGALDGCARDTVTDFDFTFGTICEFYGDNVCATGRTVHSCLCHAFNADNLTAASGTHTGNRYPGSYPFGSRHSAGSDCLLGHIQNLLMQHQIVGLILRFTVPVALPAQQLSGLIQERICPQDQIIQGVHFRFRSNLVTVPEHRVIDIDQEAGTGNHLVIGTVQPDLRLHSAHSSAGLICEFIFDHIVLDGAGIVDLGAVGLLRGKCSIAVIADMVGDTAVRQMDQQLPAGVTALGPDGYHGVGLLQIQCDSGNGINHFAFLLSRKE